ncbi:unnamed protein product [Orchesella dallaii]|uniref:MYND-type domain-containing protein n=1 Tax=Orchesella dallaii TaxID=48710 RepID=A0ABP1RB52_9HEXA
MASKYGRKKTSKSKQSQEEETWRENFIRMNNIDVNSLKAKASEGSIVAASVLDAVSACFRVLDFIEGKEGIHQSEWMDFMRIVYDCVAHEYQPFNFQGALLDTMKQISDDLYQESRWRKGEDEMKLRFCYIRFTSEPSPLDALTMPPNVLALLKESVEIYPDNVHFYILLVGAYYGAVDLESALFYTEKGVKKFPNNPQLLYFKASILLMNILSSDSKAKRVDVIAAFQEFLSKAPEDHPYVPKAYYHMTTAYAGEMGSTNGKSIMERFYKLGKEAEKKMLPCYSKQESNHLRAAAELLLKASGDKKVAQIFKKQPTMIKSQKLGIFERKPYLQNPNRKEVIISHRQLINEMNHLPIKDSLQHPKTVPKLSQSFPKSMSQVKPIALKEMKPVRDKIYEDRVIDLTIIEDSNGKLGWIQVITQDENGDVVRLFIYNEEISIKESLDKFGIGKKFAIFNPYMQVGDDEAGLVLRNYEPKCIVYLDHVQNMCRFCGDENSQLKCSKCKEACYCSKECEQHDWKMMRHKLICQDL